MHDPAIQGGRPVIPGTRIPIDVILGLVEAGWTIEAILEELPSLTREDVVAATAG